MSRQALFISFSICGATLSPAEISIRTGIKATTALKRGERNPALVLPRQDLWMLRSEEATLEVGVHWSALERVLVPQCDVLREIAGTGKALLAIVINNGEMRCPSLMIPVSMSRFAAHVNAIIDIDHMQ